MEIHMLEFIRIGILRYCIQNLNWKIFQCTLLLLMTRQEVGKMAEVLKIIKTQKKFKEVCGNKGK